MTGAAALAGMAALRGGAGLVRVAVPDRCLETVASHEPSYMTVPLPCDVEGRISGAAHARSSNWPKRRRSWRSGRALAARPIWTA